MFKSSVNSLNNMRIHCILLKETSKEFTLINRSGDLQKCDYSYAIVYRTL